LAPFVIVCLGLLTLVAWEVNSITRDAATDAKALLEESQRQTSATDAALSGENAELTQEPEPAGGARRHEPERQGGTLPDRSAAPATQIVGDESQGAPATVVQSAVRWASEARPGRARQRFIELRETLVSEPGNEAVLERALELARELQWHNEACDLLGQLVRRRPEDAGLRFELATELMLLEHWLEAIPQLRFVVRQQPESGQAWYNLALAHQALGHLRDARVTWDRVVAFMPENADVYAYRGEVLLDLGAWSAAAADFEAALQLEPNSIDATMNLSLALFRLGQLKDARGKLLAILEHHPAYVPALNRLAEIAWALYRADPVANAALSDETVDCCRRSLAVDAEQPQVKTLLERATTVED